MSYYINNANTLTLTLEYVPARGFEVVGVEIEPNSFTNLPNDNTGLDELEIKWQADSTAAIANLKFVGDFVPSEIKSTLPVTKVDGHYEVKYDSFPLADDLVPDEKCTFTLKMPEPIAAPLSGPLVRGASEGGALRTGAGTRPRPVQLAGSLDVTPSTPTVKLVLLPTRKTSMPTNVRPPGRPIARSSQ